MPTIQHRLRRVVLGLGLALASLATTAAPTTQLGFLIDASGSISTSNFNTMRNGYAAALGGLPTDGSIELTVFTFSTGVMQVVAPTLITVGSLAGVVSAVQNMAYTAGTTATAAGINAITAAMLGSANYDSGLRSIINIATDGEPNVSDTTGTPREAALQAALNASQTGIDALTAEAIGNFNFGILQDLVFSPLSGPCTGCGVMLADGSTPTDPMTNLPWVLQVNSFDDFPTAINAKVQAIVAPQDVPEPGALALVITALGALGTLRAQRRRSAA